MRLPAVVSRVLKAAVTPIRMSDWFWPVVEPFAGAWQHHITADRPDDILAYSGPFACTTLIAGDISKMRLKLVEEQPDGTCKDVTATSPLAGVLRKPNDVQNRIKFVQSWLTSKLLHGNAYILIGRDNRYVVNALYVLDPRRVTTLVSDDGSVFYRLSADNLSGLKVDVTVPASEIIHDLMVPLFHPLVGVSPIYACGMSATMGRRIVNQSTAFFANGARPGGTLNSPGKLDPEYAAQLKREWESSYGGANSGKTAVLANGLKYEPIISTPAQDAQLIEQLGWTIEDIARCYHIPLFMLGGQIPANATVETLAQMYYSQCLQVLIEELELSLTIGLALKGGLSVECDLDGLLRMDTAALVETEAAAVKAGFKAPNESRKKLNLPPVKGGESPYLQQQNYSLEALSRRDAKDDPFESRGGSTTPPGNAPPEEPMTDKQLEDLTARVLAAVRKDVEERLATIPAPEPGRPGKDADPEQLRAMVLEAVAALPPATPGKDGRDGADGKDGAPGATPDIEGFKKNALELVDGARDSLNEVICQQYAHGLEQMRALVKEFATPGKDGADGKSVTAEDVRSVLEAEVAKFWLEWERRAAERQERALAAIPVPANGLDGLSIEDLVVTDDGDGNITLKFSRGEVSREFVVRVPRVCDKGVYREETKYIRGDGTTANGSWWIAQVDDPKGRPGTPEAEGQWRLAVKAGRDAKGGKPPTQDGPVRLR